MYKIGIIGPESTGKTTLSRYLANRYHGRYVPEYARTYIEQLHRPYTQLDVLAIAKYQVEEMRDLMKQGGSGDDLVVFDTELIVTRVWLDYCYGESPGWLLDAMRSYTMDVYLLTYPDIAWLPDVTRENGDPIMRFQLFRRYRSEIESLGIPYYIIKH